MYKNCSSVIKEVFRINFLLQQKVNAWTFFVQKTELRLKLTLKILSMSTCSDYYMHNYVKHVDILRFKVGSVLLT